MFAAVLPTFARTPARLLVLCLGLAVWGVPAGSAMAGNAIEHPVVVELFTSQGCSTCPPADALLGELAEDPKVVALSLHVDYWDYIGWKDPFASPEMTARQQAYTETLHKRFVYTPQMVIDGRQDIVGTRRSEVMAAVGASGRTAKPLTLTYEMGRGGKVLIPGGHAPEGGATIWLAVYDNQHETAVTSGENAGRQLRYANVVRRLTAIGTWTGQPMEVPLDLDRAAAEGRDGCAILVQQGRTGPILGAIKMAVPPS